MIEFHGANHIYSACVYHTATATEPAPKIFTTLSSNQRSKATHIHCYECGCHKSKGDCPIEKLNITPVTIRSNRGINIPTSVDPASIRFINLEQIIDFKVSWKDGEKFYQVEGNLPSSIASGVLKAISNPSL